MFPVIDPWLEYPYALILISIKNGYSVRLINETSL